jgi:hypothetical protein
MQDAQDMNAEQEQITRIQARLKAENQLRGGASWFWWIAGLSLVNSIIMVSGGQWNFVLGLAITQFVDTIAQLVAKESGPNVGMAITAFGLALDVAVAGLFVLFGFLARKGMIWSFIAGMVLYAIDGLIFLWLGSWVNVGFHAFALFGLYGGLKAARTLRNMAQANAFLT